MSVAQRHLIAIFVLTLGVAATGRVAASEPLGRNRVDARELEILGQKHPDAIPLLERGETALREGRLDEALGQFEQAAKLAPDRALPHRRQCQVLSLLGRTQEAKLACEFATAAVGSALDTRASVGAALSSPRLLTPAELTQLEELAERTRRLAGNEPWGYAAECDIARRIGDTSMLKECIADLTGIAPGHYETEAARASALAFQTPRLRMLGWLVLAVLCAATWLSSMRLRSRVGRKPIAAKKVAALLVLACVASMGRASAQASDEDDFRPAKPLGQLSTKYPIDLNDPLHSMPAPKERNANPIEFGYWLMDLSVLADNALHKEDYAAAAKYFEAIVAAVPDRAVGYSKLCRAYVGMQAVDKALAPCKRALAFMGATVEDHLRFAHLVIGKKGNLAPADISDLDAQVSHLRDAKIEPQASRIACELATRLDDLPRLQACTAALVAAAPEDLGTVSFQWALALKKRDFSSADQAIRHAQALGMTPEGLERMRKGTEQVLPLWRLAVRYWRFTLGGLSFLFAAAVLLITWRRTSGQGKPQTA